MGAPWTSLRVYMSIKRDNDHFQGSRHSKCSPSPVPQLVKNLPASAGEAREEGLIPGSGRSPRDGNGYSLQYSRLKKYKDRGTWWGYSPRGCKELRQDCIDKNNYLRMCWKMGKGNSQYLYLGTADSRSWSVNSGVGWASVPSPDWGGGKGHPNCR